MKHGHTMVASSLKCTDDDDDDNDEEKELNHSPPKGQRGRKSTITGIERI